MDTLGIKKRCIKMKYYSYIKNKKNLAIQIKEIIFLKETNKK